MQTLGINAIIITVCYAYSGATVFPTARKMPTETIAVAIQLKTDELQVPVSRTGLLTQGVPGVPRPHHGTLSVHRFEDPLDPLHIGIAP
jgi:hypothetical protein